MRVEFEISDAEVMEALALALPKVLRRALSKALEAESTRLRDIENLKAIMSRAKTDKQKHHLSKMIRELGGTVASYCKCGVVIPPKAYHSDECEECTRKAYGK